MNKNHRKSYLESAQEFFLDFKGALFTVKQIQSFNSVIKKGGIFTGVFESSKGKLLLMKWEAHSLIHTNSKEQKRPKSSAGPGTILDPIAV